jgi:hypothetical protein
MAGTVLNLLGISALDITGISSVSLSQGVISFTIPTTPATVPGGSNGDIQYNNAGAFGGSAATINAAGTIVIPVGQEIEFEGYGYGTAGLSWLASDTLAVGNGSQGDVSGGLGLTALILFGSTSYSAYDLFHTTILSGATQNWNLILPETPGVSGQVLTTNGLGFTYWTTPANTLPWSSLTNATGNLSLTNGTFNTTLTMGTATVFPTFTLQNTTPTVTGPVTTLALTQATRSGSNTTYTFTTESGAGSNAWDNASVTVAGFTNAGNNGTFTITASTTTTFTVINASGVNETHAGTAISSAVVQSPAIVLAGTVGGGTNAASIPDSWTIQTGTSGASTNNPAPTIPNPKSALFIKHSGSSTTPAYVVMQAIQSLPSSNLVLDFNGNGGGVSFTQQGGLTQQGSISWGSGGGNVIFGMATASANSGAPIFLLGFTAATANAACITLTNNSSATINPTTGTTIGVDIGNGNNTSGLGNLNFHPTTGSASFVATQISPIINAAGSSGNFTALKINPTMTAAPAGVNLFLDLQNSSVSKLSINTSGVATVIAGNTTTKNGLAATISTNLKTAQSAALSAVSLVASTPAVGMWRISFVATTTTAGSAGSVLGGTTGFQITFVNANGDTVTKTTSFSSPQVGVSTSTADTISGDQYCYAGAATAISYSFGYTAGTPTAGVYDIAVYAEFLG